MAGTLAPDAIDAVFFDSYGTLLDTESAARALDGVVEDPAAVAERWRDNALFYSVVANDLDQYGTYFELHLEGLRDALASEGVELPEDRLRELNAVYHDLDPFEDVERGFERLAAAGYRPSVCSNGNPAMLDSLVESANIGDSVAELVSAHDIRTFKPSTELYEHAASRIDTPPRTDRPRHRPLDGRPGRDERRAVWRLSRSKRDVGVALLRPVADAIRRFARPTV